VSSSRLAGSVLTSGREGFPDSVGWESGNDDFGLHCGLKLLLTTLLGAFQSVAVKCDQSGWSYSSSHGDLISV